MYKNENKNVNKHFHLYFPPHQHKRKQLGSLYEAKKNILVFHIYLTMPMFD